MNDYLAESALTRSRAYINTSRTRRFISGVAISTDKATGGGQALDVTTRFEMPKLPLPLLIEHEITSNYGVVTELKKDGTRLLFTAELHNVDTRTWDEDPWGSLLLRSLCGVSVRSVPAGNAYGFTVDEISLVASPKDRGAKVQRIWTAEPVVRLAGGRSMNVIWDASR